MVKIVQSTAIPPAANPLLQVQAVSFGYTKLPLVYAISLQIRAGEMVGLLGPNGSGKTTLLRLLSGVLHPQQGHILLEGRDLKRWGRRAVAQRIAVVPQELHVPFAFTVEHMVSLGRTPFVSSFLSSPTRQDRAIVQDAILAAGISQLADRVFNELSGGERQRVLIAMALAQQPAILLLDEPTSHLDIKYQVETLAFVQQLNRERGMTVIAALHDLNLAARYFSRLVLFQRGIVADASPAEVLVPDLLRRVYGVDVQVGILRGTKHLSVLPLTSDESPAEPAERAQPRIHVIAGGGSGELMMRALADAHLPFSAGALNIGDSDHTLALRLADEVITEQPFSPLSAEALARVHTILTHVALLILCPTAIGPGNLALLQEALQAAQGGLPVLLLSPSSVEIVGVSGTPSPSSLQSTTMEGRDYTGGTGLQLLEQLIQVGAKIVASVSEALEFTKQFTALHDTLTSPETI